MTFSFGDSEPPCKKSDYLEAAMLEGSPGCVQRPQSTTPSQQCPSQQPLLSGPVSPPSPDNSYVSEDAFR